MASAAEPGIDFYVDIIATATVRGADAACSSAQVEAILGTGFVENRSKRHMWRDYGLAEFFWEQQATGQVWRGTHFTVQAHRLTVPLLIDELKAGLQARGFPLTELPPDGPGCRQFIQSDSGAAVLVDEGTGQVLKISAPGWPRSDGGRVQSPASMGDSARHLVKLADDERARWAERRQPEPGERTNWWLGLFENCLVRIRGRADARAEWAQLALWVIRHSEASGAFTRVEAAQRLARLVAELRMRAITDELAGILPSADEVVRACLDALPATRTAVPTRDNTALAPENLDAMRISRQAKNLLNAALPHLDHVQDAALRTELQEWADIRTRLF